MADSILQAENKITDWVAPGDKSGEFKRGASQFRDFVKKGGQYPPEAGRYHLYVRSNLYKTSSKSARQQANLFSFRSAMLAHGPTEP